MRKYWKWLEKKKRELVQNIKERKIQYFGHIIRGDGRQRQFLEREAEEKMDDGYNGLD